MIGQSTGNRNYQGGLTLVEIMVVVAIVGLMSSIAVPAYNEYVEKARNSQAIADVSTIMQAIDHFYLKNNQYPASLADVGFNATQDPWGGSYYYMRFSDSINGVQGFRKDKNLKPVNSDYDLYSAGKDGDTKLPFTPKVSQDDIVRCNNGRYIGLAEKY